MNEIEAFANSSFEDMKKGYQEEKEAYVCLLCGEVMEKGMIYREDGVFFDAEKSMKRHIKKAHGSVFEFLMQQDKKNTGLSEHQGTLLRLLFDGSSDSRIQQEMGIGSSSTVRNHRFLLKEKEKQAKLFLVLMELIRENNVGNDSKVKPHKNAKMVDDRYDINQDENAEILRKYFPRGLNGPVSTFSMKEKNKIVVLKHIATKFELGRKYAEKEVNEVLKAVHEDFVLLRRYLIEYGFMDRKKDCSEYWVATDFDRDEILVEEAKVNLKAPSAHQGDINYRKTELKGEREEGEFKMDRKKELIMQYKEIEPEAGVYLIKNKVNGKVGVFTTPNMRSLNGKMGILRAGSHMNKALQKEWNEFGEENFEFVVAELLEKKEESAMGRKDRLKALATKWIEQLEAYEGEKGYHKRK